MARTQLTPAQLKQLLQAQLCSLPHSRAWEELVHSPDRLGRSSAIVVKVWETSQTVKTMDCAACGHVAEVPCVTGCRGIPGAPEQAVSPAEWWRLVEELPESFDPHPVWDALGEVVFLV